MHGNGTPAEGEYADMPETVKMLCGIFVQTTTKGIGLSLLTLEETTYDSATEQHSDEIRSSGHRYLVPGGPFIPVGCSTNV